MHSDEEDVAHNVDVMLTIDTTGSMWDHIDQVKANATALVDRLAASGASWRMGIVTYRDVPPNGDSGDYASRLDLGFTSDRSAIKAAIAAIEVGGGGDTPETVLSGIQTAVDRPWRNGAKKAVIVLGDAPPHDPEPASGLSSSGVIAAALAVDPAEIYPVLINPYPELTAAFQPLADGTGGQVVASDGAGDVVEALSDVLTEVSSGPIASAGGPYAGEVGEPISMSASASFDPDGPITSYEWDFDGDGTYDGTTMTPLVKHTYATTPLDGQLSLRVTDEDGSQTVAMAQVTVIESVDCSGPAPAPDPEPEPPEPQPDELTPTITSPPAATNDAPAPTRPISLEASRQPTTGSGRLPLTGSSIDEWIATGVGLVYLGITLGVLAARRRRAAVRRRPSRPTGSAG